MNALTRPPAPAVDWKLAELVALDNLPAWAPEALGQRAAFWPPGAVTWWPNRFDGVHALIVRGRLAFLGDWQGRAFYAGRWFNHVMELVAHLRGTSRGSATAWACRKAGVPELPRVSGPARGVFR
jgi:hypothetical protein